jgi:4a-hydroxytetrahydrobiopterin dehydratase
METTVLNSREIEVQREKLVNDWQIKNNRLILVCQFEDFKETIYAVNRIGKAAEQQQHHPNLRLFDYKNLEIEIYTHNTNGLTEKDFALAEKIEEFL